MTLSPDRKAALSAWIEASDRVRDVDSRYDEAFAEWGRTRRARAEATQRAMEASARILSGAEEGGAVEDMLDHDDAYRAAEAELSAAEGERHEVRKAYEAASSRLFAAWRPEKPRLRAVDT